MEEAGGNITMNFIIKEQKEKLTPLDDSNPFWLAFKQATDDLLVNLHIDNCIHLHIEWPKCANWLFLFTFSGIHIKPTVPPGGSDSRFIRRVGIPALGFSPMPNTIPRLHNHDEYLNAETYLEGIQVYKKIISNLGNVWFVSFYEFHWNTQVLNRTLNAGRLFEKYSSM